MMNLISYKVGEVGGTKRSSGARAPETPGNERKPCGSQGRVSDVVRRRGDMQHPRKGLIHEIRKEGPGHGWRYAILIAYQAIHEHSRSHVSDRKQRCLPSFWDYSVGEAYASAVYAVTRQLSELPLEPTA